MSSIITLNCWPSNINCMDWSSDGIVAISSAEHIQFLASLQTFRLDSRVNVSKIPNVDSLSFEAQEEPFWHVRRIRANEFSEAERPLIQPLSFQNWSIGEEVSSNIIVSLAWSSPGLAKYNRPALAVLTSNLLLSIWESTSRPDLSNSWSRQLIINHSLRDHFASEYDSQADEILRRRTRVRAYAWLSTKSWRWNRHFLAVSNDYNEIVILEISLHSDPLGFRASHSPEATVLACFAVFEQTADEMDSAPTTFDAILSLGRFARQLAWHSMPQSKPDQLHAIIAYSTADSVAFRSVEFHLDQSRIVLPSPSTTITLSTRASAPFKFVAVQSPHCVRLVTFSYDSIVAISLPDNLNGNPLVQQSIIDGHWDCPSAMLGISKPSNHLQIAFHISTLKTGSSLLSFPDLRELDSKHTTPTWKQSMVENEAAFSLEHGLSGHVFTKVWGFALAPAGDFVACCTTSHPNDQPESSIPTEQFCTVEFSDLAEAENVNSREQLDSMDATVFESKASGPEAIWYSIKCWMQSRQQHLEGNTLPRNILKALQTSNWPSWDITSTPTTMEFSREKSAEKAYIAVALLQHDTMYNTASLELRCSLFESTLLGGSSKDEEVERNIVMKYVENVGKIKPVFDTNDTISKRIIEQHDRVKIFLSTSHEIGNNGHEAATSELCEICESPILMKDLRSATCVEGHQYDRCSLTFLAVQAPGLAKSCSFCKRQYLSDAYLLKPYTVATKSTQKFEKPSLARALVSAFLNCLYCGCRFVHNG